MSRAKALLSANIKAERRKLGITQEKLAELTDLSVQTITDIEGCRTWVSDKTLQKLAGVLRVDMFELLIPPAEEAADSHAVPLLLKDLRAALIGDIDRRLDQFFTGLSGGGENKHEERQPHTEPRGRE
jgi:transcriptional regulator with XRE-family HTH domain